MKSKLLLFAILALHSLSLHAQHTVNSVPNPKLIDNSYVSNPDRLINDATVEQINTRLRSLEDSTSVQVAVVVLKSIGEADVFEFAQDLFETWGIGSKGNDNGLLILFVEDQREIRFHTGYGVEGALTDLLCKRIQADFMVPAFKEGNYSKGMLAGIDEVVRILTDPTYAEELNAPEVEVSEWTSFIVFLCFVVLPVVVITYIVRTLSGWFTNSSRNTAATYPELRLNSWLWLLIYAFVPVIIVVMFWLGPSDTPFSDCLWVLYLYYLFTRVYRFIREKKVIRRFLKEQDYYEIVQFIRKQQWYWFFMALLFPVPFLPYFFYHLARKRKYRNHPRSCKECKGKMEKLNDVKEDEYLSTSQLLEEKLRTVDYDVWKCKTCNATETWFYLSNQSKYDPCPKCKTIAYYLASTRTIKSATYSSDGTGERIHECKFCNHKVRSTYTIAQLTRDTSSSGSSFSSGSSSSSGGSWGGGSSGGGGASSKW